MSGNDITLGIRLRADGSGLVGELRLSSRELRRLGDDADRTSDRTDRLRSSTGGLRSTLFSLQGAVAALGIGALGKDFVDTIAQAQGLRSRLTDLVGGGAALQSELEYLDVTSEKLSANFFQLSDSYAKLLVLQKGGLITQQQTRAMLEGLADAAAVNGASTAQVEQAMYGLSQGLAAGTLRAEELNQVMEPMGDLMLRMDKAAGVATGGFRKMVNAGEVSSEMFAELMVKALNTYDGASERMAGNITQTNERMGNSYIQFKIKFEDAINGAAIPAMSAAISSMDFFSDHSELLIATLSTLALVAGAGGALMLGMRALPVVLGAGSAAMGFLQAQLIQYRAAVAAGAGRTAFFNRTLFGMSVQAQLASGALSKLMLAGSVLFAAFAGYQIGTMLSEQFAEVRVAGIFMVRGLMKGWEHLKFTALASWEAVAFGFEASIAWMKGLFGDFVSVVASGLESLPFMSDQAADVRRFASELQGASDSVVPLIDRFNELSSSRDQSINLINEVTDEMAALELATETVTQSSAALSEVMVAESKAMAQVSVDAKQLGSLLDSLFPDEKKARIYFDSLEMLDGALASGQISAEKHQLAAARLHVEYAGIKESVSDLPEAFDAGLEGGTRFGDVMEGKLQSVDDLTRSVSGRLIDDMTKAFRTGKFEAADFFNFVLDQMIKMQLQQSIGAAGSGGNDLLGSVFSFFGGADSGQVAGDAFLPAAIFHSGGVVGSVPSTRSVSPALFKNAPRYHSGGIVAGEVPAILQRGEEVLTANDPRHSNNRGAGVNGITVTTTVSVNSGTDKSEIAAMIGQGMNQARDQAVSKFQREISRGGNAARVTGRR